MSICSVDYVKSKIFSSTLTDTDISTIIFETRDDVLTICGVSDESDPSVSLAIKYSVLAAVLRKMKTTGEMAATYETPGSKYQNTTDKDIDFWQSKADKITQMYEKAKADSLYSYSSPSYYSSFDYCGGS